MKLSNFSSGCSHLRGSQCSDLTGKLLKDGVRLWRGGRLREVLTIGDSTVYTQQSHLLISLNVNSDVSKDLQLNRYKIITKRGSFLYFPLGTDLLTRCLVFGSGL